MKENECKPLSPAYLYYLNNWLVPIIQRLKPSEALESDQAYELFDNALGAGANIDLLYKEMHLSDYPFPYTGFITDKLADGSPKVIGTITEERLKQFELESRSNYDHNPLLNKIEETLLEFSFRCKKSEEELINFLEGLAEFGASKYEFKAILKRASDFATILDPKSFKFDVEIPLSKEVKPPKKIKKEKAVSVAVETTTPLSEPPGYEDPKPWQGCEIAEFFTEEARQDLYSEGHWAAIGKDLYRFNGSYYEKVSKAAEERRYMDWAGEHPTFEKGKWVKSHCQPDHINKIWVWVLSKYRVEEENVNPPGLNLKNGRLILEWKNGIPTPKLIPHSPKVVYTYTSEVSYNPKADPQYCDQLLQALEPDQQAILLRSLALAIDFPGFKNTGKFERIRAVLCEGTGSNGKDAIRNAVAQIFVRGMTSLSFNDCQAYDKGQKGEFLQLETACLSWSSENSGVPKLDELQGLKAAITSDSIPVKALYEDKKMITPYCVFFFNINGVPRMDGALEAIISRWAILRFQKTFKLNPDPSKGQIKGDPRFKDSPQWVAEAVCPALLNRLLDQIPLMLTEGIPYDLMDRYFREMREESCHLWGFVKEARIIENQDGKIGITELWNALLQWYEEMGTLEYVTEGTKTKQLWHDQHSKYDRNITAITNVYKGFQRIFPKITRGRVTVSGADYGRVFISGISFIPDSNPFASILSGESVPASILSSLPLFKKKKEKTEKESDDQNSWKLKSLQDNEWKQNDQKSDQTEVSPENNNWREKNGHQLSKGMWVCLSNRDVVKLLAPAPIKGCWAADKEGAEIQIDESQISLVWEV